MSVFLNWFLIFITFGAILLFIVWRLLQPKKTFDESELANDRVRYTYPSILEYIKTCFTEITTQNLYIENLTEEEFKRRTRHKQEVKEALKSCNTGDLSSKIYVREYIYKLLTNPPKQMKRYNFNEENINWVTPFDKPNLMSAREKFETLLYLVSKKHSNKALGYLIDTFDLSEPKSDGGYRITDNEINEMYKQLVKPNTLRFEDKLYIISQIAYSQYKGFGIIDEVRDMDIDGVSGGISGLPERINTYRTEEDLLAAITNKKTTGMNSAWIMYKGKSIHLSFLSFEHESELRRVVTNIYKYNYPGQLSETRPYIINEMYDGSRVTVMRPKLSESWAFFIRKKYDIKLLTLSDLITHKNHELPIGLLKYLMKGNRSAAITGPQGSGKSTLLMAMIAFIHPTLNLRIQETSFELNLRSLYPKRNILSFQETDTTSGQDGLDLQKKTDGHVTILGEVATDPVAAWMIQSAQVASLFTIFTHHAKTFGNLVHSLRNSLLKVGMFSNESIAEQQVVSVLEFDIHMRQDYNGTRYIERITECVPIAYEDESVVMEQLQDAHSKEGKLDALIHVATNYFRQQTQRKHYLERTILEYREGEYVAVSPISEGRINEMVSHLAPEEREQFHAFIKTYWG